MVTTAYDTGDLRQLKATFKDINGVVADPTLIALTIREPDGILTTKAIGDLTKVSTGIYTYDFLITKSGRHVVNWSGTETIVTAEENEFYARKKEAV